MRRPAFASVACLALPLLSVACGPPPREGTRVVAEIEGRTLTSRDVEEYLEANLMGRDQLPDEHVGDREADDLARSRLFDDFIDEQLMLVEAQRRGISADDDEVEAYLRAGGTDDRPRGDGPKRREAARRTLTVQKLRERWVRSEVRVTPDEVDVLLSERREAMAPERRLTLRSVRAADEAEARTLRDRIRRRVAAFPSEAAEDSSAPLEVDLSSLPVAVRAAVEGLRAGEISAPVRVQGTVYLFRVETWAEEAPDEQELRRRAEEEILRAKHEEASRRFIREMRRTLRPRINVQALPFRYVPEAPPGA